MDLNPALVMAMWSAGLAAAGGIVAVWAVVGRGYTWLAALVVVLFGLLAAGAGGGVFAWFGVALAGLAGVAAASSRAAAAAFAISGVLFVVAAASDSPVIAVVTGATFLGGVAAEMMLGHWYLVDPRLPRWALRRLIGFAGVGLAADVTYLATQGVFTWTASDVALGGAFVALTAATALLGAGVWFSLKEPKYTGVMAATGLSYLATLTSVGAVVVGRMVAFG